MAAARRNLELRRNRRNRPRRGLCRVRTIRLTGGEPLLRRNLDRLVAAIVETPGIEDVALSTNGMLLREQLDGLVAAGLRRINLSLDTLRSDRFEAIARRPETR